MRKFLAITTILSLGLCGCATVPPQLAGTDLASVTPQQAANGSGRSEHVRWGGEILKVTPNADDTCFEVLSRALYPDARPKRRGHSEGRFIACRKGFYDPELYHKGRELTVVGQIEGTENHKVGDYNYTYPRVDAEQVYLWPERSRRDGYYSRYYDPYWGPVDPFWGSGYWGYGWWAPPVIIVHGSGGHSHHGH